MLRRMLLVSILCFSGAVSLSAQTAQNSTVAADNPPAQRRSLTGTPAREPLDPRIEQALRERDAIIRNLLERVQQLEDRLNVMTTSTSAGARIARIAETTAPAPAPSRVEAVVNNATYDETERRATQALDQALVVRGGLLLPPGTLEIDNTVSYFSASSDHVAIDGFALLPILVVGDITSQRVREDFLLPTFTTRLGLPSRVQMDFTVPYGYVLNRTVDALGKETTDSQFGLGDIQAGISRQLTFERGHIPDLLANVRFKSVTGANSYSLSTSQTNLGSGFYAVQGNLTAAKSSDPVVFFGNISYTENLAARHTLPSTDPNTPGGTMVGHIQPGNSYGFQLGSILALNPDTSMTLGWDQRFTRSAKLNGSMWPGSYLVEGTLRLGTSYVYAPGRILDLSFGVGLTPDTPNLQFSVGLPFRLSLWKPRAVH